MDFVVVVVREMQGSGPAWQGRVSTQAASKASTIKGPTETQPRREDTSQSSKGRDGRPFPPLAAAAVATAGAGEGNRHLLILLQGPMPTWSPVGQRQSHVAGAWLGSHAAQAVSGTEVGLW